jgi:flagella basal body P-ring formation protein FlgA
MNRSSICFGVIVALVACRLHAAEIDLKPSCQPRGAVVLLGDVADVHSPNAAEKQRLAAIELMPAPSRARSIKLREIQDLLALQGVNLSEHNFAGATQVQIGADSLSATAPAAAKPVASKLNQRFAEQAHTRVARAIATHLETKASRAAWQVDFDLAPADAELIGARLTNLQIDGGREPWTGEQQFTVALKTTDGVKRIPVKANVSLPEMVVVPRRPLRRGEVIQASDLVEEMPQANVPSDRVANRMEDIVGRETTRSIATGQPIEVAWLKKPVLVRRGEVVTVFARAGAVQVRTNAKAVDEGGQGDIVTVERLDTRQRFAARVIGVQELEVFVSSVSVSNKP